MRKTSKPLLMALALCLLACQAPLPAFGAPEAAVVATGAAEAAVIAPRLRQVLEAAARGERPAPVRGQESLLAVWVFFRDRPLDAPELERALAAAEDELAPRTARRRAKMRAAPDSAADRGAGAARLVDQRDLPVADRHLAAVAALGARPRQVSRWLNAASFDATPAQAAAIASLPGVRRLDLVARYRRTEPPPAPAPFSPPFPPAPPRAAAGIDSSFYGPSLGALAQLNVPAAHAEGWTGAGVLIGLLDTGFRTTHESLAHLPVVGRWDFVNGDPVVENEPGDPSNAHNHGTSVLSALAGLRSGALVGPAYGAAVALAKTEDVAAEQPIEEDWWVAGLEWLESLGADIVSSSLGYTDWYEFADLDGATAVTTVAGDLAAARGVLVVNAAGNERASSWGHIIAPADGDSIIAVGAVDLAGAATWFSSPGPTADGRIKPDLAALGTGVRVALAVENDKYGSLAGTSLACPLVAGVAALVLQRAPGLTPMQVRAALRATASLAAAPDNDLGWGIADAHAAVHWFGPAITHAPPPDTVAAGAAIWIGCRIVDRLPLDPQRLRLWHRDGTGPWQAEQLAPAGPDSFAALLPGRPHGTVVSYYLEAIDLQDILSRLPAGAPDTPFTFLALDPLHVEQPPARTVLLPAAPNPFNQGTWLRFELASAGPVRLDVHDARGRLVRRLHDAPLPAGRHALFWDGRDRHGRSLTSGMYLARLTSADASGRIKLQLVR